MTTSYKHTLMTICLCLLLLSYSCIRRMIRTVATAKHLYILLLGVSSNLYYFLPLSW
ncbi:hypothetical protein BDQ17DRAFT_1345415 [Cyathus striatus]|nr:hypothetical protein BDQ17DRAFT_1345415 [Cyathus striatus]